MSVSALKLEKEWSKSTHHLDLNTTRYYEKKTKSMADDFPSAVKIIGADLTERGKYSGAGIVVGKVSTTRSWILEHLLAK